MIREFCDRCGSQIPLGESEQKYQVIVRPYKEGFAPLVNALVCTYCKETIVQFVGDVKK